MNAGLMDEHAYAILSLTTRLAWTQELPQPLSRTVVRRMLDAGALCGLVLREVPGIDAACLARASALLTRVRGVAAQVETYEKDGWRLLFPGRALWPDALNALGAQAPLFLFARGNAELLKERCIALAGSRRILRETRMAAERTGRMIAGEGMTLVTGGAKGADNAAQSGALAAGGNVVLVPAVPAGQLVNSPGLAAALEQGRALILCDTLPDEPFSAAKALGRNHTIYALGSAALVVAAREGNGGSWRGAADCLRGGWSPVYVWDGDNADTVGNCALRKLGAKTFALNRPLREQLLLKEQMTLFDYI